MSRFSGANETSAPIDKLKSRYRPSTGSTRSTHTSSGSDSSTDSSSSGQPFTQSNSKNHQCVPDLVPLNDADVEQETATRTEAPAKPEDLDTAKRPLRQQTRQYSDENDGLLENGKPTRRISIAIDDNSDTESRPESRSCLSSSSRSSGTHGRPRVSADSESPRRSSSAVTPRRHSAHAGEPADEREGLCFSKVETPRRPSVDNNRVTVRQLSEPMHRCNTTNQNVSGIMRRAKYSSNSLSTMASVASDGSSPTAPVTGMKRVSSRRKNSFSRRNASVSNLTSMKTRASQGELRCSIPSPSRTLSVEQFQGLEQIMSGETMSYGNEMENDDWIASGVDFSKSMEVYLFKS